MNENIPGLEGHNLKAMEGGEGCSSENMPGMVEMG